MRAKKVKPLNKDVGKKGRKLIKKDDIRKKFLALCPDDTSHTSKKRHANESMPDFKSRRKASNKRKRERIKLRKRNAQRT